MNTKYQPSKKLKKADGTIAWIWEGKLHNWEEAALISPDGKKLYGLSPTTDNIYEININ